MHREIETPACHPDFGIPVLAATMNSRRPTESEVVPGSRETGKKTRDKSGANHARSLDKDPSRREVQPAQSTDEVFSLLRYSSFIPHEVVERWSRFLRSIDMSRPEQGLAVLDELIGEYRVVFHACRLAAIESAERNLERPAFETELGHLKDGLDRLACVLISVEAGDSVSA